VIDALGYGIIAAALALAVWGYVAAALDRPPGRALFAGAWVVAGLVAVQALIAVARIIGGADVDVALFAGYILTAVVLEPAAVYLARLEPTRWGSVILASGGLVLAPLTLRLLQIWRLGDG
jgi:heme A synthase